MPNQSEKECLDGNESDFILKEDLRVLRVALSDCDQQANDSDTSCKTVTSRASGVSTIVTRSQSRFKSGSSFQRPACTSAETTRGSEDQALSMEVSSGAETEDGKRSRHLKRPSSSLFVPGFLDSDDTEPEGSANAKVAAGRKGRRGKASMPSTGPSREDFKKPPPVQVDGELDRAFQRRQYRKGPTVAVLDIEADTGSDSGDGLLGLDEISALNA